MKELYTVICTVAIPVKNPVCLVTDIALLKTVEASESSKIYDSVEMVDAVEEQSLGVGAQMNTLGLGGVQLSELACFLWEQVRCSCDMFCDTTQHDH